MKYFGAANLSLQQHFSPATVDRDMSFHYNTVKISFFSSYRQKITYQTSSKIADFLKAHTCKTKTETEACVHIRVCVQALEYTYYASVFKLHLKPSHVPLSSEKLQPPSQDVLLKVVTSLCTKTMLEGSPS